MVYDPEHPNPVAASLLLQANMNILKESAEEMAYARDLFEVLARIGHPGRTVKTGRIVAPLWFGRPGGVEVRAYLTSLIYDAYKLGYRRVRHFQEADDIPEGEHEPWLNLARPLRVGRSQLMVSHSPETDGPEFLRKWCIEMRFYDVVAEGTSSFLGQLRSPASVEAGERIFLRMADALPLETKP